MKKILLLTSVLFMAISFSSCENNEEPQSPSNSDNVGQTPDNPGDSGSQDQQPTENPGDSCNCYTTVNANGFDFAGYWFFEGDFNRIFLFEKGLCTETFLDEVWNGDDVYIDNKGYIHGISRDTCHKSEYAETFSWRILDTERFIFAYFAIDYVVINNDTVKLNGGEFDGAMHRIKGFAE